MADSKGPKNKKICILEGRRMPSAFSKDSLYIRNFRHLRHKQEAGNYLPVAHIRQVEHKILVLWCKAP